MQELPFPGGSRNLHYSVPVPAVHEVLGRVLQVRIALPNHDCPIVERMALSMDF